MAAAKAPKNDAGDEEARRAAQAAADEAAVGQEPDGQLFVMEGGVKIGLSSLMERGTPVHYEFKLDSKGVKGGQGMGLISFSEPDRVLVVPGRGGKIETDPTYNGDGTLKSVTVRQHFKPSTVHDSKTEEAAAALGL